MVAIVIVSGKHFQSMRGQEMQLQDVKPLAQGHTASKSLNLKESGNEKKVRDLGSSRGRLWGLGTIN